MKWSIAGLRALFGLVAVMITGCGDAGVEPSATENSAEVTQLEGRFTSNLWKVENGVATHLASAEAQGTVVRTPGNVEATVQTVAPLTPKALIAPSLFTPRDGAPGESVVLRKNQPGGAVLLRPVLPAVSRAGEPITFTSNTGETLRAELIGFNRGRANGVSQRIAGMLIFKGDRVVAKSEYKYRRQAGKLVPKLASITLYDSIGRPEFVAEHDFQGMSSTVVSSTGEDHHSAWAQLLNVGKSVAGIVVPRKLEAATTAAVQEEECSSYDYALALAISAEVAASAALARAVAACAFTLGVACPGVLTATAAWGVATAAVLIATEALEDCWEDNGPPGQNSSQVEGQGSYIGGEICWQVDWYESRDGGVTWTYIGTDFILCPDQETAG